jgi:hypothetical protein
MLEDMSYSAVGFNIWPRHLSTASRRGVHPLRRQTNRSLPKKERKEKEKKKRNKSTRKKENSNACQRVVAHQEEEKEKGDTHIIRLHSPFVCVFSGLSWSKEVRVQLVDRQADTERKGESCWLLSWPLAELHSWRNLRNKIGGDTPLRFSLKGHKLWAKFEKRLGYNLTRELLLH